MAEYELNIKIPNAAKNIQYKENLTGTHESYPEDFFKKQENRQKIRDYIETQSQRIVSEKHLDQIIKQWIEDIKSGYSPTTIPLDLPPKTTPVATQTPPIQTPPIQTSVTSSPPITPPIGATANPGTAKAKPPNKPGKTQTATTSTTNQGKQQTQVNLNKENESTSNGNSSSNQTVTATSNNQSQEESKKQSQSGKKNPEPPEEPTQKVWTNTNKAEF